MSAASHDEQARVMIVRPERPGEASAIRLVNDRAFGQSDEGHIVDRVRQGGRIVASLVASEDTAVIGHILFTPVTIDPPSAVRAVGLGPMAVEPPSQRRGIGSALVRAGLRACQELGCDVVVVLGHPEFYPRFGFKPASAFGLRCTYAVPDDVFMAIELEPGVLAASSGGTVHYGPEFG